MMVPVSQCYYAQLYPMLVYEVINSSKMLDTMTFESAHSPPVKSNSDCEDSGSGRGSACTHPSHTVQYNEGGKGKSKLHPFTAVANRIVMYSRSIGG